MSPALSLGSAAFRDIWYYGGSDLTYARSCVQKRLPRGGLVQADFGHELGEARVGAQGSAMGSTFR